VILECSNGMLDGVATMNTRRRQLEIDVRADKKLLQGVCGFIVEVLQQGLETSLLEEGNTPLVSCDNGRADAIDHGFRVNVIAVVFIHDEDVLVAGHTRDKKISGWVSVHHAGGTMTVSIN
jgi:hypothetical protein